VIPLLCPTRLAAIETVYWPLNSVAILLSGLNLAKAEISARCYSTVRAATSLLEKSVRGMQDRVLTTLF